MSSGTGSTGAAAAALARGGVSSPVRVLTPAGPIDIRFDEEAYLTGPAEIVAEGEFFCDKE
jgi:diaminopimelate epimerase